MTKLYLFFPLAFLMLARPSGAQEPPAPEASEAQATDTGPIDEEVTSSISPSREVSAEARQEAESRFKKGLSFFQEGDHALALIEFERAYQLVPNYRVLYNIGQVSIELSRFARARQAFAAYLEQGRDELDEARIASVEKDLAMLSERTAYLAVEVDAGAEVFVDDESQGFAPLAHPLLLDAGEHTIRVQLEGKRTFTQRITLAGAEELNLPVTLKDSATSAPVVIVKKDERPQDPVEVQVIDSRAPTAEPPYAVIAWSATGALVVSAVVTAVIGNGARSQVNEIKSHPDPDRDELQRQVDKANRFFLATDILAGAALVGAGVSLYFTLRKAPRSEAQTTATLQGLSEQNSEWKMSVGPRAISLSTTF